MPALGNAVIGVTARTANFENSLRRSIKRVGAASAAIVAGLGTVNFFGNGVEDAIALEKQMLRIQTLLTEENAGFENLFSTDQLRNLSDEIGVSVDKVAESAYNLLSSGVHATEVMDSIRAASNTAIATASDLKQTVDFTSSALNAFGDEGMTAAKANDILFKALQYGKGSMNDFAKYISTAIPIADALGVSLEDLAAAAASNTLTGSSARKVFTGLKVAMQEFADVSKGGGKYFFDRFGRSFQESVEDIGFSKTIEKFLKKTPSSILTNIFGAKEGAAQLQQLSTLWDKHINTMKGVADAEGSAAASADKVNQSMSRQLERLQNLFRNFRGRVGDWLGPILFDALEDVKNFFKDNREAFNRYRDRVVSGFEKARDKFLEITEELRDDVIREIKDIDWDEVFSTLSAALDGVLVVVGGLAVASVEASEGIIALKRELEPVISALASQKTLLTALVAGWVAYKVAGKFANSLLFTKLGLLTLKIDDGVRALRRMGKSGAAGKTGISKVTGALKGMASQLTTNIKKSKALNRRLKFPGAVGAIVAVGYALNEVVEKNEKQSYGLMGMLKSTFQEPLAGAIHLYEGVLYTAEGVVSATDAVGKSMGLWETALDGSKQNLRDQNDSMDELQRKIRGQHTMNVDVVFNGITNIKALENPALDPDAYNAKYGPHPAQDYLDKLFDFGKVKIPKPRRRRTGLGEGDGDTSAADKLKDMLDTLAERLSELATKTGKMAKSTIKDVIKSIRESFRELDRKDLIPATKKLEERLIKLAKRRDYIIKKLFKKKEIARRLREDGRAFKKNALQAARDFGDVTQATEGLYSTFTGMRVNMRKGILQTKAFIEQIKKLDALGLNRTNMRQLLEAGPEALDQARAIANSGAEGVSELNELQKQLNQAGKKLGKIGYNKFFKDGIQMANGVVAGLKKRRNEIEAIMDKVADKFAARIGASFGIKVKGVAKENRIPVGKPSKKNKDGGDEKKKATYNTFNIEVSGVKDEGTAKKVGKVIGDSVADTLSKKKMRAKLDGVR